MVKKEVSELTLENVLSVYKDLLRSTTLCPSLTGETRTYVTPYFRPVLYALFPHTRGRSREDTYPGRLGVPLTPFVHSPGQMSTYQLRAVVVESKTPTGKEAGSGKWGKGVRPNPKDESLPA